MTDYLAEIAARTVWCLRLELLESEVDEGFGDGNPEGPCSLCKGLEEVLDPRFEELREVCYLPPSVHYHMEDDPELSVSSWMEGYISTACPGYNVNRDLAVLLGCILPIDGAYDAVLKVMGDKELHRLSLAKGDVFTEAAAKVVYEWLEAQCL